MIITYSALDKFRNCRRWVYWRYLRELVPIEEPGWSLPFGSLIHSCLEAHYQCQPPQPLIDAAYPDRATNAEQRRQWHLATAMIRGYRARYAHDGFCVVALEQVFEGPIVNPDTRRRSRGLTLAGRVDGVVQVGKEYFILEHKTASHLDGSYLERLWMDLQISLYAIYIQRTMDIPVAGVIYNVLLKSSLKQTEGETEAEYQQRYAEACAASKSGKSSAKRKMPETDDEFQARLTEYHHRPEMYHRETLYLSRDNLRNTESDLWQMAQEITTCQRTGRWYRNTGYCLQRWGRCPYYQLCMSDGSPIVANLEYQHEFPNQELKERN